MQQIRSCWHFLLAEPFRLIFSYLFQPTAFKSKFETDLIHRLLLILRICLPVFLCMYPIVLLVRLILPPLFPGLYVYTLANSGIRRFLFDTAWATALGTTGGILGAVTISTSLGITLCISVSLLSGITVDTSTTADKALEVTIMAGMTYGILFGVLLGLTVSGAQSMRARSVLTIILGGIVGCAIGIIAGLITGFMGGLLLGTLAPSITGPDTTQDSWGGVIGGTLAVSAVTFISGIVRGLARRTTGSILRAITVGRSIGIAFSVLMGVTGGVIGVISASRNIVDTGGQYNKNLGAIIGLTSGGVFLFCYVLSMSLVESSLLAKQLAETSPLAKALTEASILSDQDILKLIADDGLKINPYDNLSLNSSSVDLKLGSTLIYYLPQTMKIGVDHPDSQEKDITGSSYTLHPGEFVLGMTKEWVCIPNGYLGVIETKGNIARAGILVHNNDGHIDAGFSGHITLEIVNFNKNIDIELVPDTPICQLFIGKLSSECSSVYKGKYLHQATPTTYRP